MPVDRWSWWGSRGGSKLKVDALKVTTHILYGKHKNLKGGMVGARGKSTKRNIDHRSRNKKKTMKWRDSSSTYVREEREKDGGYDKIKYLADSWKNYGACGNK